MLTYYSRSAGRFAGKEAEPRPGVRPGHIPTSFNVPYSELFDSDGTLKQPETLASGIAAPPV